MLEVVIIKDKKLPSCTRCINRGSPCEYKEPVFKKSLEEREKSNSTNIENITPIVSMFNSKDESTTTAIHSIKQNTIEAYCSIICCGGPPFRQQDLEKYLLMGPQELLSRQDILAFLLSVQGLCEQLFGFPDLAEESMNRARNILSQVFDDFDNPFVACTYCHIALFNVAEGNIKKARGYLNYLEHFIINWKSRISFSALDTPSSPFIDTGYGISMNVSNLRLLKMVVELVSCETHPVPDVETIERLTMDTLGLRMPDEWKDHLKWYTLLDTKKVEERLQAFELVVSLIHYALTPIQSDIPMRLHSLNFVFTFNGIRLFVLLLAGVAAMPDNVSCQHPEYARLLEYAALCINKATESDLFPYISTYQLSYTLVAMKVNLEICKMIDRGERQNNRPVPRGFGDNIDAIISKDVPLFSESEVIDYYTIVAKDLRALQILSKRYRYLGRYTNELSEFLSKRTLDSSHQMDLSFNQVFQRQEQLENHPPVSKRNRVGTFYNEMKTFLYEFNKGLGNALAQSRLQQNQNAPPPNTIQSIIMHSMESDGPKDFSQILQQLTKAVPSFGGYYSSNSLASQVLDKSSEQTEQRHGTELNMDDQVFDELFTNIDPLMAHASDEDFFNYFVTK